MINENFGILVTINWNSHNWSAPASNDDLKRSNFSYVKENYYTHEDLNFGHEKYPLEDNGRYIAYVPQFEDKEPAKAKANEIKLMLFKSQNPLTKEHFLIGMYGFPSIGLQYREAHHEMFKRYDYGFVSSLKENISLFKNPLLIIEETWIRKKYLPLGKKLGQQGWNYLSNENVLRILDKVYIDNKENLILKRFRSKMALGKI